MQTPVLLNLKFGRFIGFFFTKKLQNLFLHSWNYLKKLNLEFWKFSSFLVYTTLSDFYRKWYTQNLGHVTLQWKGLYCRCFLQNVARYLRTAFFSVIHLYDFLYMEILWPYFWDINHQHYSDRPLNFRIVYLFSLFS